MSLGGRPPDLVDQVRAGTADFAWTLPTYQPGRFPLLETWTLPFMVTNAERTAQAIDQFMRSHGKAEWEFVQPLAWWCQGPAIIMTKGKRIERLEDLKGLRLRGGSQPLIEALELLGASAQFYPVPELAEQLTKGTSDGAALQYELVPVLKLHELLDHFAESEVGARGLYTVPFLFAMNRRRYESLPEDLRRVIDANSGASLSRRFGAEFDAIDGLGRSLAARAGRTVTSVPAGEIERWRAAAAPVADKRIAELNKRNLDGKALVAAANALIDRFARMP
jgi:TRAP-type C4-dicarboxylate transport system substrate-binding protein